MYLARCAWAAFALANSIRVKNNLIERIDAFR
jgi:hypothetical protein